MSALARFDAVRIKRDVYDGFTTYKVLNGIL